MDSIKNVEELEELQERTPYSIDFPVDSKTVYMLNIEYDREKDSYKGYLVGPKWPTGEFLHATQFSKLKDWAKRVVWENII